MVGKRSDDAGKSSTARQQDGASHAVVRASHHGKGNRFSLETRTAALEQIRNLTANGLLEWTAILQVARDVGCASETLRRWLRWSEGRSVPIRTPLGPGTGRGKGNRFSSRTKEQAIRKVAKLRAKRRSEWAAIVEVAGETGCKPESLRRWLRRAEGRETPRKPGRDRRG